MKTSSIYRIECRQKNRCYIGVAFCFMARKHAHLSDLYSGRHSNNEMQADFDELGEAAFDFVKIRDVAREIASSEEMQEIARANSGGAHLYNGVIPGVQTRTLRAYADSARSRYYLGRITNRIQAHPVPE